MVLGTTEHHVCCISAPDVEVVRTPMVERRLERLGPDVLGDEFEPGEVLDRVRTRHSLPIADVLLDQSVVAGIGNVYKSELLFLAGVNPNTLVGDVTDDELLEIGRRARQLLALNVRAGPRTTTGERARGRETWVYGRAGKPCRRCASGIEVARLGDRVTYWCPGCQPAR